MERRFANARGDANRSGTIQDADSRIPDSSRIRWRWSERIEVPLEAGGDIGVRISDFVWPQSDAAPSYDVGVRLILGGADGGGEPLARSAIRVIVFTFQPPNAPLTNLFWLCQFLPGPNGNW